MTWVSGPCCDVGEDLRQRPGWGSELPRRKPMTEEEVNKIFAWQDAVTEAVRHPRRGTEPGS